MAITGIEHEPLVRHVARLEVAGSLIFGMLKGLDGSRLLRQEGIPEDARLLEVRWDSFRCALEMLVESAEFAEVKDSEPIPALYVTKTMHTGFGFKWPQDA